MSKKENEGKVITGHEVDGIQEFDNQLPRWWINKFYLTIVFAFAYLGYYWLGPGNSIDEDYRKDVALHRLAEVVRVQRENAGGAPDESRLVAMAAEPGPRKKGAEVFGARCASCHGAQGQGGIGPNLTDNAWVHGGKLVQVAEVISKGVPEKGMPPWGAVLSKPELYATVAFIRSLQGTRPNGAKAPQGVVE